MALSRHLRSRGRVYLA